MKRRLGKGLLVAALLTGAATFFVLLLLNTGTAPADWDTNRACGTHRGVQQVTGADYVVTVVCKDGVAINNPYD